MNIEYANQINRWACCISSPPAYRAQCFCRIDTDFVCLFLLYSTMLPINNQLTSIMRLKIQMRGNGFDAFKGARWLIVHFPEIIRVSTVYDGWGFDQIILFLFQRVRASVFELELIEQRERDGEENKCVTCLSSPHRLSFVDINTINVRHKLSDRVHSTYLFCLEMEKTAQNIYKMRTNFACMVHVCVFYLQSLRVHIY